MSVRTKKKKSKVTKENVFQYAGSLSEMLTSEHPENVEEASDIIGNVSNHIGQYIDFARGISDIMKWTEDNRIIYGRPFKYDDAAIEMMLGDHDKKLALAPRPYLNQYLNDKCKDKTVIKCRQCLIGDTVVTLFENGETKTIRWIVDNNYRGQIIYFQNGTKRIGSVIEAWESGEKEILQIRTKSGHSIQSSYKEKVWNEGKKRFTLAKDLKKGDYLNIYRDSFGNINDRNIATLAGYYFGDGCSFKTKSNRTIAFFTNTNREYLDDFCYHAKDSYREYKRKNKEHTFDIFLKENNILRKKLVKWDLIGKRKPSRKIPSEIFQFDKTSCSIFINRLFAADGWFSIKKRKKFDSYHFGCGIASSNVEFLIQVQQLLLRFDIYSGVKEYFSKRHKTKMWKLMLVSTRENTYKFAQEIGIYGKINEFDIELLARLNEVDRKYIHRKSQLKNIKYNQIISIKKKKIQNTYDITISNKQYHNFYANNILVSNSEFTENEINENIYLAISRPYTNVRHIFPTAGMANKISKEKISPAIEESPKIARLMKKPFNLTSKSFQNGSFYTIDSSWTDYQGRGPSSDKLTFDEYESQNPQIEDIFSESTSHSEIARKTRISTPKFPNSGIDLMYQKGCEYEWYFTCPKCGREQTFEFPNSVIGFFEKGNVDVQSEEYIKKLHKVHIGCKHCGQYIDRASSQYIKNARWVPKKIHMVTQRASYRVNYMMLPWKTGVELLYKYHTFKFLHQFYNEIMGIAYVSPEAQITRDIFEQCQDFAFVNTFQKLGMARNISIGVDWGTISWVVVRANGFLPDVRKAKVIYVERIDNDSLNLHGQPQSQTEHAKRVADIFDFFGGTILVNDANGIGVDRNAYLTRKYPTRAYGCFYDTAENQRQKHKESFIQPQWNDNGHKVTVSRVATFKALLQEYEAKKVTIPRIDPNIEEFIVHHAALVVERYEDEDTGSLYEIIGATGDDHYAHADNYSKIGFDKLVNNESNITAGVINGASEELDILKQMEKNMHSLGGG